MSQSLLRIAADFDTQLATASSIGATTATLVSATDDDGNALPTGLYGLTIDAGNSSKEYIICTLTSTALTGILSVTRQGVTSSGFARTHRRGAKVTLTDWAILKRMLNNLDGTTGFDSASPLSYDGNPTFTADGQIITKKYADDLAIAGSPDASTTVKGISKLSSAPASPTEPIAVGTNDTRVPTQDENDALAGTSGTPSSSNKYVTNDDTAENTASKLVRRKSDSNITVPTTPTAGTDASSKTYTDTFLNIYTNGVSTHDASATGAETIAHGLGKTPKKIRIKASRSAGVGTLGTVSEGTYNGTTNSALYFTTGESGNPDFWINGTSATQIVYLDFKSSQTNTAIATFDATNITLTWSKGGSPTGTVYLLWEAEA